MFDTETFIREIESRPAIWRQYSGDNRETKSGEWQQVARAMYHDWDAWSPLRKNEAGRELQKKWKNIKDNFTKALKDQKTQRDNGGHAKKRRKYIYFDQLAFLLTTDVKRENLDDVSLGGDEDDMLCHDMMMSPEDDMLSAAVAAVDVADTGPDGDDDAEGCDVTLLESMPVETQLDEDVDGAGFLIDGGSGGVMMVTSPARQMPVLHSEQHPDIEEHHNHNHRLQHNGHHLRNGAGHQSAMVAASGGGGSTRKQRKRKAPFRPLEERLLTLLDQRSVNGDLESPLHQLSMGSHQHHQQHHHQSSPNHHHNHNHHLASHHQHMLGGGGEMMDEDRAFFHSLLPSVRRLNDEQKIDFRLEMLSCLRRLHYQKHTSTIAPGVVTNGVSNDSQQQPQAAVVKKDAKPAKAASTRRENKTKRQTNNSSSGRNQEPSSTVGRYNGYHERGQD